MHPPSGCRLSFGRMIQRLWNFAKRHKKKLLGSAFLAGGSYVAWKVLYPRLCDYMLQRLMKNMEGGDLLKELMAGMGEDPEDLKAKRRANFNHNQQVSDSQTQKSFIKVYDRLISCFNVDELHKELKQAKTKDDQLRCFEACQVECFARSMAALYTLHLLLLLHRVQFNIVGREIQGANGKAGSADDKEWEVFTAFCNNFDLHVQGDGLAQICDAMREAVKSRWRADSMSCTQKVSRESFRSFLVNVCITADAALLEGGKGPATLLPESLDASAATQVKKLLDETRDYLESPQFLTVFRSVVSDAVAQFVTSLSEDTSEPPQGAPLPRDASVPIAKLGNHCLTKSEAMYATGDPAGYVRRFADGDKVANLCEALYFEDGKKN